MKSGWRAQVGDLLKAAFVLQVHILYLDCMLIWDVLRCYMLYTFHVKCIPKYFMCLDIFVNDSGFENKFLNFSSIIFVC